MKKIFFLGLLFIGLNIFAQADREVEYIQKYAKMAVEEMEAYKIPASITLAQGILETGGGQSRLAEQANNHFGIKCKKEWTGEKIYHDDDARGECFRKYPSPNDSYRDHSKFLAERPYYRRLFDLPLTDYKAWAHGLKKAGYATNPRYAQILISKIEKHGLNQLDTINPFQVYDKLVALYGPVDRKVVDPNYVEEVVVAVVEEPKKVIEEPKEVIEKPAEKVEQKTKKMYVPKRSISPRARVKRHAIGREYVVVNKGETLSKLASTYKTTVDKLMKYNELEKPEDLLAGQYLFFSKKKSKGAKTKYKVVAGDNMYLISQKGGIKLAKLYRRNRLKVGYQPKVGEIIYLRGKRPRK